MKILFFCAHPDDLEFFLGYFITSLANSHLIQGKLEPFLGKHPNYSPKNIQISVASMTRGEYSSFTENVRSTKKAAGTRKPKKVTFSAEGADLPQDLVAEEAYYIWRRRGGDHGHHEDDWREAERAVRERLGL